MPKNLLAGGNWDHFGIFELKLHLPREIKKKPGKCWFVSEKANRASLDAGGLGNSAGWEN